MFMLYSIYPFYENYAASWKSNPCQTNKNKTVFFTFLTLNFS